MDLRVHLFELTSANAAAHERIAAMSASRRDAFAKEAQREAGNAGLLRGTDPIPLVLSPVALPREEFAALGRASQLVVSALVKVARELIDRRPEKARLLFSHLSPLELEALRLRSHEAEELVLGRVDWFVKADGRPRALEVNATIPAMPVYSDAAARGFLTAVGRGDLFAKVQSNAAWVVESFLAAARGNGRKPPMRVQLLHRAGDPQLPEMKGLAVRFGERGCDARPVTPTEVVLDGEGAIYRHIFARYVEPKSFLAQAFLDPVRYCIWNRVDGWLETKGLLAELSLSAGSSTALTAEEKDAAQSLVPWTRLLDEVTDAELGDGDGVILKRSHDYGGKSVVIGRDAQPDGFRLALRAARGEEPGSWVVQELVDAPAIDRFVAQPQGAVRGPLHLDISTYASLIPGVSHGGSVVRGAAGRVVNIVGGGGVAPLLPDDVLREALDAIR
ncbi:MAG: hypothetical protein E6J61_16475 [Deltaproteobacteria bacterium]|nr:MAG: hypothetical protein E6J61_16475 [Deltaproteobacteria bacterium]